jgi:acetyl esterase/lipase
VDRRAMRYPALLTLAISAIMLGQTSTAVAPSATPSIAPPVAAPSPGSVTAVPSPDAVTASGTCDPVFQGLCSIVPVGQWHDVPYTPSIPCTKPSVGYDCQLTMDITAPTSGGPYPIVVFIPGGSSTPEDRLDARERYQGILDSFARALAGQGAVVMVGSWREAVVLGGGYPTSFEDVACAIGVAREIGPAYGASPDRVTLVGHSTGGWPAMVLGVTPTPFTPTPGSCDATAGSLRPDAAVSMDGAIDEVTAQEDGHGYVLAFLGGDQTARPEAWAASDPFALVKRYPPGPDTTPLLLIHGASDHNVPPAVSESFQAALVAAGYASSLVEIPGVDHLGTLARKESIDAIMGIAKLR